MERIESALSSPLNLKSLATFLNCLEKSSKAWMVVDHLSLIQYVNPVWKNLYGFEDDEVIGQSPKVLHSGLQSQEFYRNMWSQIKDPHIRSWGGQLVNRARDGTLICVHLNIHPLKGDSASPIGYIGLAQEISRWKPEGSSGSTAEEWKSLGWECQT